MNRLIVTAALLVVLGPARAAILYSDDFSGYAGSGLAPGGGAGTLDSGHWAVGGLSDGNTDFGDTRAGGDFGRGRSPGGVTTGGLYAFQCGPGAGAALGIQPTGSDLTPGLLQLRVVNDLGAAVRSPVLSYVFRVLNDGGRATSVDLAYLALPDGGASPSLLREVVTAAPADPQPQWEEVPRTVALEDLTLAPGDSLLFAWRFDDAGGAGARDEIALDDVRLEGRVLSAALPEPAPLPLLAAALGLLGAARGARRLKFGREPPTTRPESDHRGPRSAMLLQTSTPVSYVVQINGEPVTEVTVHSHTRRALEMAAMEAPAVCELIGERTIRGVEVGEDRVLNLVC